MRTFPHTAATESDFVESDRADETPASSGFVLGDHPLLEDVIPQIYYLAQHVGGMKRLAEIVAELERSQPE